MQRSTPNVFNIASGLDPLRLIARRVVEGFPFTDKPDIPLHAWTILLPSRRSARRLGQLLRQEVKTKTLLLPRILPLGDLDAESIDLFASPDGWANLSSNPAKLVPSGLLFEVYEFVQRWANANPHLALAADVAASPVQGFNLARSLVKLVDQTGTEEVALADIASVYKFNDIAGHRENIVELVKDLDQHLTTQLHKEKRITAAAHRNAAIRDVAEVIAKNPTGLPVIAAGSTGTNPATRDLLKAIALAPAGALILPGLDKGLSKADWLGLGPTHPQWGLSQLLAALEIGADDVAELSDDLAPRGTLSREMMRSTELTHLWHEKIPKLAHSIKQEARGLHLMETVDRHEEALAIALIMRKTLRHPSRTAALITPDRELAQRVKAELLRWSIAVEDSAGEPLSRFGAASLAISVISVVESCFAAENLVGLLHNALMRCGLAATQFIAAAQGLEIAALRQQGLVGGPDAMRLAFVTAKNDRTTNQHLHPVIKRIADPTWQDMEQVVARVQAALTPLADPMPRTMAGHIELLQESLDALAGEVAAPGTYEFHSVMQDLVRESQRLQPLSFRDAAPVIAMALHTKKLVTGSNVAGRLAIYGLPEARMLKVDVAILGGLNETIWPEQPDPGPWLNRSMRQAFGLQQPERVIGLTAHDLAENLGAPRVFLCWSKRAGKEPLVPSRWILRLETILQAAGIRSPKAMGNVVKRLARSLDAAPHFQNLPMPRFAPPVAARPRYYNVTDIEKLHRDPYAIYARKTLELQPLEKLAIDPDARLRGTIFHAALEAWTRLALAGPPAPLQALLAEGRKLFAEFEGDPDIENFWWPRFERMAEWVHEHDTVLRDDVRRVHVEERGKLRFPIGDAEYTLSGRADRIDILADGRVRIIDYKTGKVPSEGMIKSGLSPQMTLEAAMLKEGAFEHLGTRETAEALYVLITGGRTAGEVRHVGRAKKNSFDLMTTAAEHLAGLKEKLAGYAAAHVPFLPRVAMEKEDSKSDYDHLSRYREWSLKD
jgi:ATP-dependent helicase/nuclease subunit B